MTIQITGFDIVTPDAWREIVSQVGLTDKQKEARGLGIGGSDAKKIMHGDWHDLWLQKTGAKVGDDLDDVFYVKLGVWTEPLNKAWYAKQSGNSITNMNHTLVHPDYGWMVGNIDGLTTSLDGRSAVFEAKHCNAFAKLDDVAGDYYPQAQHYMAVTKLDVTVFSVIIGTNAPVSFEINRDETYIGRLIDREKEFWWHVQSRTPPGAIDAVPLPPLSLDNMREVDLTGNNAWADLAATWIETHKPAKKFEKVSKDIKAMVEADVKKATGHGITVTRTKNGALTIREE